MNEGSGVRAMRVRKDGQPDLRHTPKRQGEATQRSSAIDPDDFTMSNDALAGAFSNPDGHPFRHEHTFRRAAPLWADGLLIGVLQEVGGKTGQAVTALRPAPLRPWLAMCFDLAVKQTPDKESMQAWREALADAGELTSSLVCDLIKRRTTAQQWSTAEDVT